MKYSRSAIQLIVISTLYLVIACGSDGGGDPVRDRVEFLRGRISLLLLITSESFLDRLRNNGIRPCHRTRRSRSK